MDNKLKDCLSKSNIGYKIHSHSPIFTVEQSKVNEEVQKIPGLRTKNLFLKDEKSRFYLVCTPGEKRLNMKKLKLSLSVKELHFGSPEEMKREINLTPGSVSIFGMIYSNKVTLILDKEVIDAKISCFHPNMNTETLEISSNELKKFINSLNCNKLILSL